MSSNEQFNMIDMNQDSSFEDHFDDLDGGSEDGFEIEDSPEEDLEEVGSIDDLDDDAPLEESEQKEESKEDESEKVSEELSEESKEGKEEDKEPEASEKEDVEEFEEVKINGELQKFSREEVLAKGKEMISGQVQWDKKFSELDKERQGFKKELDEVNGYVSKFREIGETSRLDSMAYLGEIAGLPPYQIREQLLQELYPEFERRAEMTESELRHEHLESKNDYLEKKIQSDNDRLEQEQSQRNSNSEVDRIRETANIAMEEWDEALTFLREHESQIREENPNLTMDADFVAGFVTEQKAFGKAESILKEVSVELGGDEEFINGVKDIILQNADFDDSDIKDIIEKYIADTAQVQAGEKLEKKVASPTQEKPQPIEEEEIDWDDF